MRHKASKEATIEGIKALGLTPFVKDEMFSTPGVTGASSPISSEKILSFAWEKLDVMLSAIASCKCNVIDMGHMGYTAQRRFVTEGISALGPL